MPSLLERVQQLTGDDRLAAIREAAATTDPTTINDLVEILASPDFGEPLRQAAAESVAQCAMPCVAERLLPLRTSAEAFTRTMAALGLGGQTSSAAIQSLVLGLADPVNTVRNWSERSLVGQISATRESGVPALLDLLTTPVPLTRSPAARILGLTRDPRGLHPLMEMAGKDPEWLPRMWALKGLGDLGLTEATELVIDRMQNDPKNRVRAAAAEALGKLRPSHAETLLRAVLDTDDDDGVLKAAGEALRSLGFEVADINDDGWE
ncbi:MAG: HEAT repeat domain-containing protein [Planctomycetota bacterium]|nr:MAG: HEAT repeat domain-containing protein [Planctomycetota bacterium]